MTDTTSNPAAKPRRPTASAPPQAFSPRPQQFLSYMHRPPRIMPNYGKRPRGVLPKSSVSRVLLYDNVTQQQMLHVKVNHLSSEQLKTGRLMDMHRKSFITRRQQKERQMAETALHVDHDLLEQGLLSANIPRNAEHKARDQPSRAFNPYLEPENDTSETPHEVEHHETSQLSNDNAAEDSPPQNGHGEEEKDIPARLSIDRQRAITSDCLILRPPSFPAKLGANRAAHTAKMQREVKGHSTLPNIHAVAGHPHHTLPMDGKMFMDTQQPNGFTRILHTFHSQDSWEGGQSGRKGRGGRTAGGGKMMEDERYRKLEKMLVRIEPRNEGYMELSPSFHTPRQAMTFTRPSSFHSSLHRRRSSSSSSSSSCAFTRHLSV